MRYPRLRVDGRRTCAHDKVFGRVVPFLMVCYTVAYLDRVNLGFAKLQMCAALGFDDRVYGLGAGIFFLGYIPFQIPSNLILVRVGARRWIGSIMIAWGLVSALFTLVHSGPQFYAGRFLLGVAEAGFYPGVVYYLSSWVPSGRFARAMTLFMAAIPLAGILGNPVSGWIMDRLDGVAGLGGWRWLFLLEAAPAIICGCAALLFLKDHAAEAADPEPHGMRQAFGQGRIWLLCSVCFLFTAGQYGLSFWLPTLVGAAHIQGNFAVGLVSAIPYAAALVSMLWLGRRADACRERRWHLIVPAVVGAAGLAAATALNSHAFAAVLCLSVAAAGILPCTPLFWSLPTAILRGRESAGVIGGINACGNFAGFVSPVLVGSLRQATHHEGYGMYALAAMMIAGAIGVLRVPSALVNR